MKINFNLKRTFKINGKEYGSLEEMPPGIRALFEKAAAANGLHQASATNAASKIVFNGVEYESMDEMPTYIRSLYQNILQSAEAGRQQPAGRQTGARIGSSLPAEPSLSVRSLVASLLVAGLLYLVYYLYSSAR